MRPCALAQELCCELGALQLASAARLLLSDLAHTVWRLRLCDQLADDISRCNQVRALLLEVVPALMACTRAQQSHAFVF